MTHSQWISKTEHLSRFVALQTQYNLLVRDIEREHVPVCRELGLGILPWSPLAAGFLSGKYSRDQPAPAGARLEKWKDRFAGMDNDRGWRTVDAVKAIAKELQTTPSAVSLAWLLAKPNVTSVIMANIQKRW